MAEWIIADNNIELSRCLPGVPLSVQKIMKRRGIDEKDFKDFLSTAPRCTYDPFLLPDLREVCEKLRFLCDSGKKICIYGDYDADGITSASLMYQLLEHFTDRLMFYIPSRFKDGYGPNKAAFSRIKQQGADAIITVDCGITSKDEMDFACSIGLECIVTDHHILRDGMTPDCLTVNPHRPDSAYPFSDLSGCGVAFKIAQGMQRLYPDRFSKKDMNAFLDLVAVSTVADIVPLVDENRCLVKYGLKLINSDPREGIAALLRHAGCKNIISAEDISFVIAPNINALGRVSDASDGVRLLIGGGPAGATEKLAADIVSTNLYRKSLQENTAAVCRKQLAASDCGEYVSVILAPGAHEGVAGIVAGMLKEEFNKPVCILTPLPDGSLKGTGRSIPGINLHSLFEQCGDVFIRFGGHAGACGFVLREDCIEIFRERINAAVRRLCNETPGLLTKKIYIEKELSSSELNLDFAGWVAKLAPFGEANPVPLFCINDAKILQLKRIGSDEKHLRMELLTADGTAVQCIYFGGGSMYDALASCSRLDVAGELSINEFRDRKNLQIKVVDVRVH